MPVQSLQLGHPSPSRRTYFFQRMDSPLAASRKVPHCRSCGLPRKGHPRGVCGSPGSTPERERSVPTTPQTAAIPKPLMPGRFTDQRPSEVFVESPLLDRIGPKIEEVDYDNHDRQDVYERNGPKAEEPDYGVGLGNGVPLSPARRGALETGPGATRQRHASTPLCQMPTLLNSSMDTILPEHSISNAHIRNTRVFSAAAASHAWRSPSPTSSTGNSASLVSDALRPARPPRNMQNAPSEVSSEAPSLAWSDAIRESGAKPLAVLYSIPTRFGAYLQSKSRRTGADAAIFPLENGAALGDDHTGQQAVLVHGERDFIPLIQPHRNETLQNYRQRTPARSNRSTPAPRTPTVEAPAVPIEIPAGPAPPIHYAPQVGRASESYRFLRNLLYIVVGVFIGISLTFYFLLRLDSADKDDVYL